MKAEVMTGGIERIRREEEEEEKEEGEENRDWRVK